MRRSGGMFSGGIGKFEKQADTRTKRKTIKGLRDHAETITEEHCRNIGNGANRGLWWAVDWLVG